MSNSEVIDTGLISKAKEAARCSSAEGFYALLVQPLALVSVELTPKEKWKMRSHTLRWEKRYRKVLMPAGELAEGRIYGVRIIG